MFWVILAICVGIGISVYNIITSIDFYDGFMGEVGAFLASLAVLLFGICIALFGQLMPADEVCGKTETQICALSDNTNTKGLFILGSGSVDSEMYYYYLTKNENNGKKMEKIKYSQAVLFDDKTKQPRIVEVQKRSSNPLVRFFFITESKEYEIHIPPKSIKYDFNVDLK